MTAGLAFGALAVALLLDATRRYVSTTAIALAGPLSPPVAALVVLLPFILQVVAVAALSRVPARRALLLCAAAFAAAARAAPLAGETAAAIVLAGVACLSGAALVSLLFGARPEGRSFLMPQAVALGLIIDLARRTALGTLDLADLDAAASLAHAALELAAFAGVAALALRLPYRWTPAAARGPIAIAAVPFVLVIAELAATNGWHVAAAAGLGLSDGGGLRVTLSGTIAVALGLALGSLAPGGRSVRPLALVAIVAGAGLLAARIPAISLAGGTLLAAGLVLSLRALEGVTTIGSRSPLRIAAAMSAGWIGFTAVTLAYWALYAFRPALWLAVAFVAVATWVGGGAPARAAWPLRAAAVGALVLPLALLPGQREADVSTVPSPLRLMTYNVHFGYDDRQIPSLDDIASTIEGAAPDVVLLQEVMRGGSLAAQHEALGWLAARLGMTYVFAPTVGDAFGNAVLTRLPVEHVERISFVRPAPLRHSPRGALLVRIAGINVINTHLDEYVDAASDAVREGQLRVILREWGQLRPVVIAGDLNAVPGSAAIALLVQAGFDDLAGPDLTSPAARPDKRIDHVFANGVRSVSSRTLLSRASDHLPVVVELTPPGR